MVSQSLPFKLIILVNEDFTCDRMTLCMSLRKRLLSAKSLYKSNLQKLFHLIYSYTLTKCSNESNSLSSIISNYKMKRKKF